MTTTKEAPMYQAANTESRVGRMLDGLLQSTNRRAKLELTVDVDSPRSGKHHRNFRVKAWTGRDGHRNLTVDMGDGDYMAGTYATKVLHVDTTDGSARPAKGMTDQPLLYMARMALHYAFTGVQPNPPAGTCRVQEGTVCGCCGLKLTHPVSIELGIGPECAKRVGLEHHYNGSKLVRQQAAQPVAAAPAAEAAVADGTSSSDEWLVRWLQETRLLATMDVDCERYQREANRLSNLRQYDAAQQALDVLDQLKADRSKLVRELEGNYSLEAWRTRVGMHSGCAALDPQAREVVVRWCYTLHMGVDSVLARLGHTEAAA